MASEFPSLPQKFIEFSSSFSLRRKNRSIFVIFVITTLAVATGVNIVSQYYTVQLKTQSIKVSKSIKIFHTYTIQSSYMMYEQNEQ